MAYVEAIDSSKFYKNGEITIIANNKINFKVEKGEFAVMVGSSGAGKSTLLNILGGMESVDEGSILIDGQDISKYNERELTKYRRYDIGFVFQFYNLVPNLTALENVELATQIVSDAMNPIEALKSVGLEDRKDNFPAQLSGGEQQRVSIARAIAKKPKLLLCDEPTGALDYNTGKAVLKLLKDMCDKTGTTVILVTHNKALTDMADRIIEMRDAKVIREDINENPIDPELLEW
ncbi:MAG: ABC transporter ATP-binding protein [Andreesenia angusta]|nr:ABC transporter ATP-binding protein [Andreesenia angusta]